MRRKNGKVRRERREVRKGNKSEREGWGRELSRQDLGIWEERTEVRMGRAQEEREAERREFTLTSSDYTSMFSSPLFIPSFEYSIPQHSNLCCCSLEIHVILQTSKTSLSLRERKKQSYCRSLSPIT